MIKRTIQQEDVIIVKVYTFHIRAFCFKTNVDRSDERQIQHPNFINQQIDQTKMNKM